ncbi:MAG: hypothetical protein OXU67_00080 [Chloroflexota bacterium]|nr:hypothetical protein [Chloroflexota bacterium]
MVVLTSLFTIASIVLGIPLACAAGVIFKHFSLAAGLIITAYLSLWALVTIAGSLWGAPINPDTLLFSTPESFIKDSLTMTGRILTAALLGASLGSFIAALTSKTRAVLMSCYVAFEILLRTIFAGSIATDFSLSGLLIGLLSRYPEHPWPLYVGVTLFVAVVLQLGRFSAARARAAGPE